MILLCVGLSHKTAPLRVREGLAILDAQLPGALQTMSAYVKTGVILSTCNRTEVYSMVGHERSGRQSIVRFLADYRKCAAEDFTPYLYIYSQSDAVRHLLRVASGLDSLILGEDQILGQVKEAYQAALSLKVMGPTLSHLFSHAVRMGKRARHQTGLSRNGGSVSWAAVQFAKKALAPVAKGKVLIIGAGDTSRLTGRALVKSLACDTLVTSRTYQKAQQLAGEIGGRAIPFDGLPEALSAVDLVISSTDSPTFVLDRPVVEDAMQARDGRPLLLIDVAVPRDIHPDVGEVANVSLHDMDELKETAELDRKGKEEEAAKVEGMVEAEADGFMAWWASQEVVPTIKALRTQAETIKRQELEKTLRRLKGLSPEERRSVEALASAIIAKMLHNPLVRLKNSQDGHSYVRVLRELFDLPES